MRHDDYSRPKDPYQPDDPYPLDESWTAAETPPPPAEEPTQRLDPVPPTTAPEIEPGPPSIDGPSDPSATAPTVVQEPVRPAPERPELIRERLRPKRRGPLRRFTLYASGVDTRILWYVPVEESEFVVQGSLVILTCIVAAVSATAAAGFLLAGHFALTPVTILAGLIWGALIFFFDRALVAGTFNPHHFAESEVTGLRDLRTETPWRHLVNTAEHGRPRGKRRIGEVIRVLLVASLRIALALATSYIVAEMALFLVFQPEVNARTAYLQQQLQAQRVASIQADFSNEAAKRAEQRTQLAGAGDPDVLRLDQQIADLTPKLDSARKDLGLLQAAAAAELDGNPYQATLSDGTEVKSTGDRGDGAAARSLAQRRTNQQNIVNDLSSRLAAARDAVAKRHDDLTKQNTAALTTLTDLDNKATADQQAALNAAVQSPSAINGLLLRQAGLTKLEHDRHPETLVDDPIPPCHGAFAWVCEVRNFLVPPTPMGPTVVAYRVIFFVIEILPITYKVISSLRLRRPYDIAKAALEESSGLDSFRLLDQHLHETSREASDRATEWRRWQLATPHAAPPPPPPPSTVTAAGNGRPPIPSSSTWESDY